jgi:adenylate cyclase
MPRPSAPLLAGAALALGLAALHGTGLTGTLNQAWFDALSRFHADPARAHPDAVLVLIDEATVAEAARRGERWPWPRGTFAALLCALHQAGARAIAADLLFLEPSEDAYQDDLLASAVAATGTRLARLPDREPVLRAVDGTPLPAPGRVDYLPDPDGTVRRYVFEGSLAAVAGLPDPPPDGPVLLLWPGGTAALGRQALGAGPLLAHGRALLDAVRASGADELEPAALRAALAALPPLELEGALRGKTVFLGASHAAGFDLKPFPIGPREPGVLVHFTAWSNAMGRAWFREAPGGDALAALAIVAGSLAACWRNARLLRLATAAAALVLGALVLGGAAFGAGLWLPPALPVLATAAAFTTLAVRHWRAENEAQRRLTHLFGSYVSPAVLHRLLEHPDRLRLGGERREVTVFFSDVAGFTELSERGEPETLVAVMNEYFGEMSELLIDEGGYLDKYIGDAIMAVFNAPDGLEAHALAACLAALACRDRLAALAPEWERRHGVRLGARIGLNTGPAVAGNVGSPRKRNYTVLGDCVNLASRLESANKAYGTTILAGQATKDLAGDAILFRPVDLLRVKGKAGAVQTWEPIALAATATEAQHALVRDHGAASALVQARRFAEARAAYESLVARDPADELAAVHAARCRAYSDHPPPPDWDGVFQLKDK